MSKNGFFHERPNDEDIYVAENMHPIIGARSINWHPVGSSRYDVSRRARVVDVEWQGRRYIAEKRDQGADYYWEIVEEAISLSEKIDTYIRANYIGDDLEAHLKDREVRASVEELFTVYGFGS